MDDQKATETDYPKFPRGSSQDAAVHAGQPPSKAMATWALVLAVIPAPIAWVVSIGLGVAVLRRSRDGLDHGKGLVIAGFIVIAVWILLVVAAVAVNLGAAERDVAGSVTSRGDVPVTELRTGDCVANEIGEDVEMLTLEVIPCEEPHYYEAFATFTLPEGDFPGQAEVDRLAEGGCVRRFENFVGVSYDESKLEFFFMRPFVDGWAVDRGVACLLTTDNRTAGSLKDAAR